MDFVQKQNNALSRSRYVVADQNMNMNRCCASSSQALYVCSVCCALAIFGFSCDLVDCEFV
ncbi:unnamed protein product, partial [Amoebophrya sp. A120]